MFEFFAPILQLMSGSLAAHPAPRPCWLLTGYQVITSKEKCVFLFDQLRNLQAFGTGTNCLSINVKCHHLVFIKRHNRCGYFCPQMVASHQPPIEPNKDSISLGTDICSLKPPPPSGPPFGGAWVCVYVTVTLVPLFSRGSRQLLSSPHVGLTLTLSLFGGRESCC